MVAKSQQNFYNKAAIVVILFGAFTFSIWCKKHEMAHNKPLLLVYVVYCLHTVELQIGTFSSLNSLGTCVQDMKSCPTHTVESSEFTMVLIQLVPGLKHVSRACPTRV